MASCSPRSRPHRGSPHIQVTRRGSYAIVSLAKEPVNTMDLAFWEALTATLDSLEADSSCRGVIFQSGLQRDIFTAGNDIMELYAPNTSLERYKKFWLVSNSFLARLYTSRLVTLAAIRGACPAGGCCLALCCDYRIMTETGAIGLNEVALGISVPKFWGLLMQRVVGAGPAEKLLQFAVMATPEEARELGLVDDVVPRHKLEAAAEAAMTELLKAPDAGRAETKRLLRGELVEQWREYMGPEAEGAWGLLSSPGTVAKLKATLDRLSGKKGGGGGEGPKSKL